MFMPMTSPTAASTATSTASGPAVSPAVSPAVTKAAGPAARAVPQSCCRRAMSSIEVTTRGTTLVLHSCTACGRHLWERDGELADRAELLAGVATFLEQPRTPTPRRRRAR